MQLMPHQKKALKKLSNGKILWGGVGVGKSLTAMAYYAEKDQCGDIYVITTAKKRDSLDWEHDAALFGISKEVSVHGLLTVDSWNNIGKYERVRGSTFIFDEQRLVGSGAWVKSFYKIAKHNSWILLSATPGDTWMDYIPVFVANGFYKNATEFKREHVVYSPYSRYPRIERFLGQRKLERLKAEILVEMPYVKHTTRKLEYVEVDCNRELLKQASVDRWNPYTEQPIKDAAELFAVMRRINNTDPSRLEAIRELMDVHPRMIVFYNFNYELEILRTIKDLWPDWELAEWNGRRKEQIPDTEKWVYLVQYQAGAEGWNCTSTDAMAFWSLNYSYRRFEQSQGRIDRLNTLYMLLHYYALVSDSVPDKAVRKSLESKQTFNEKRWVRETFGADDSLLND